MQVAVGEAGRKGDRGTRWTNDKFLVSRNIKVSTVVYLVVEADVVSCAYCRRVH